MYWCSSVTSTACSSPSTQKTKSGGFSPSLQENFKPLCLRLSLSFARAHASLLFISSPTFGQVPARLTHAPGLCVCTQFLNTFRNPVFPVVDPNFGHHHI